MVLLILECLFVLAILIIIARAIFLFYKKRQRKMALKQDPFFDTDLFQIDNTNEEMMFNDLDSENDLEFARVVNKNQKIDETNSAPPPAEPSPVNFVETASVTILTEEVPEKAEQNISEPNQKEVTSKNSEVISLTLMAPKKQAFAGYEFLQTLLSVGFRFGEFNIFHRHESAEGKGDILFSLAQAVNPGTFDLNDVGNISCPGVIIFMDIVTQRDALQTLNIMLDTAKQLAEELGGTLYDEERRVLNKASIARWRARIINYTRQRNKKN